MKLPHSILSISAILFFSVQCSFAQVSGTWDRSSISVNGTCANDSTACFIITNSGSATNGNMTGFSYWRLFSNDSLIQSDSFQIAGGDSLVLCFPFSGASLRLEADQRPGHPGRSHPRVTIANCHAGGILTGTGTGVEFGGTQITPVRTISTRPVRGGGRPPRRYIDGGGTSITPTFISPKTSESELSQTIETSEAPTATVYPNPLTSESKVIFSQQENDKVSFQLFDIAGKRLIAINDLLPNTIIRKSDLSAGVYFYRVLSTTRGQLGSGRIVVTE